MKRKDMFKTKDSKGITKKMSKKMTRPFALTGSNIELLQVRISKSLFSILEKEAVKREKSIPEVVRQLLLFHILPQAVIRKAGRKGKVLNINELENSYKIMLKVMCDIDEIIEDCKSVNALEKNLLRMKKRYEKYYNKFQIEYLNAVSLDIQEGQKKDKSKKERKTIKS